VLNGTWKPQYIWAGIAAGMVDISPMNTAIPQAVQKLVMAKRQEFIKGTAHPFDGPVKDQAGKVRVPAGQVLDDKAQLAIDWYVQGIETRG
jgi:simple sugar transport system substrate-binding protein